MIHRTMVTAIFYLSLLIFLIPISLYVYASAFQNEYAPFITCNYLLDCALSLRHRLGLQGCSANCQDSLQSRKDREVCKFVDFVTEIIKNDSWSEPCRVFGVRATYAMFGVMLSAVATSTALVANSLQGSANSFFFSDSNGTVF